MVDVTVVDDDVTVVVDTIEVDVVVDDASDISVTASGTGVELADDGSAVDIIVGEGGGGGVTSFNARTGVVVPASGDYTATQVTNTPAGTISATTVQSALNELDTEKAALASPTFTGTATFSAATFSSIALFADGAVGAPSIAFASDTDTGIYRSGANTMVLVTGGAARLTVGSTGTLDAVERLLVSRNSGAATIPSDSLIHILAADNNNSRLSIEAIGTGVPAFSFRRSLGAVSAKTAPVNGTVLGLFGGAGWDGTSAYTNNACRIQFQAAEAWSTAAMGSKILFDVVALGGVTPTNLATRLTITEQSSTFSSTTASTSTTTGALVVSGGIGVADRATANNLAIVDGITAPSTQAGYAVIYVDTSDGDLKVKFGDGTVKTIVVDT